MRRTLVLLATMTFVVVASGTLAVAASALNNGNFERGDLTGWSVDTPSGGNASAVTSFEYCPPTWWGCGPEGGEGNTYTTDPHEGSYFALLTAGYQQPAATRISQPFEASNGDKVSGWAFFQTENYLNSCTGAEDERGQVVITSDSGTRVATPFEQSIYTVDPPQYGGNSGWRYWEYTFTGLTGTAQFRIEARVQNAGPSAYDPSRMGLDDVKTSTGGGPDLTSPETYIPSGYGHVSSGVACITDSTSNTFEFNSNEQGSTFKCQLSKDDVVVQAWADCKSPKSYSNLSRAEQWETLYKFEVKATDPAGNVDPTPARRYWFVKRGTETQPPPDTTAPKVDSVFPKEDITGVARTTNVTATFSEDMMASSINTPATTFKLFKKGSTTPIAATVSYPDPTTRTATLNPFGSTTTRLARGTTYKAVVTTGAKDLAGNQLDQNPTLEGLQQMTWFFTTTS